MKITRDETGALVNPIVNDADVKPAFVHDDRTLDLSQLARDSRCRILIGEPPLGAQILWRVIEGVWEFHTGVLREGRGEWAAAFCDEAIRYMFITTDAIELITRMPQGNFPALTLARRFGFQPRWACPSCRFRGKDVPYSVWSLMMQEWMPADDFAHALIIDAMRLIGAERKAAAWEDRRRILSNPVLG